MCAVSRCTSVASLLRQFLGTRTKGFLFQTRSSKPMNQRNVMRELYSILEDLKIPKSGFHSFRRFRNTHLRKTACPDGLVKFWMGHANRDMTDVYDKVRDDVQFRRDVAKSVGVGFDLPKALTARPLSGLNGPQAKTAELEIAVST
jgi:integrase